MTTIEKQSEFNTWLGKLGLSLRQFAGMYMIENEIDPDEQMIDQFYDKIKKQIKRPTTKPEVIQQYLNFLYQTEEFQKAGFVRPQSFSRDYFSAEGREEMRRISRSLTKSLLEDSDLE